MVYLISENNGCTYTLDPENSEDLMYAPIYADGSFATSYEEYAFVEWDMIEDETDVVKEAARCHRLLLADL